MPVIDYPSKLNDAPSVKPARRTEGISEYRLALSALTPALRRIVGPALRAEDARIRRHADAPMRHLTQLAAAQALAVFVDGAQPGNSGIRDQIRSSLLRWQLSLMVDGRPAFAARHGVGRRAASASYVARILARGVSYETPVIVSDLGRHLQWLWRRKGLMAWSEAALIDAACETALVAREGALLRRARERLRCLLALQNEEGWFDDGCGCGLSEQAFSLDALARIYAQTGWPELEDPLRRAMAFNSLFAAAPRGILYPASTIPFYAAESLDGADAVRVASAGRNTARGFESSSPHSRGDLEIALAASSMALASTLSKSASAMGTERRKEDEVRGGVWIRRDSHLEAWIDLRRGGALAAAWREFGTTFEDDLLVLTPRGIARSVGQGHVLRTGGSSGEVAYRGEIRRAADTSLREAGGLGINTRLRGLRRIGRHNREISIQGDTLTIRDHVSLRRHAAAILCGARDPDSGQHSMVLGDVKELELSRTYKEGQLIDLRRRAK